MSNNRSIGPENAFAFFGILAIGLAWAQPLTIQSCLLAWLGSLGLASFQFVNKRPYWTAYFSSVLAHLLAFFWLFYTICDFGGFDRYSGGAIFALFIAISALQFPIYVMFLRSQPLRLRNCLVAPALAWIGAEFLSIRIFPWYLGHTQSRFITFCQIADIAGAATISFMMMWLSSAIVDFYATKKLRRANVLPIIAMVVMLIYGAVQQVRILERTHPTVDIALVQANISIEQKHNMKMFRANTERYKELTQKILRPGLLVIWPETVITEWINAGIKNAAEDPQLRLPFFPHSALVTGALTYESEKRFFNSALGIKPGGDIAGVYHKQILMPFGEYTPFGDYIPFLREINSTVSDFTAGDGVRTFDITLGEGETSKRLMLSPLICYEDLLPSLARASVRNGANLLVNLTNDAWFGNSAAPLQHHLIASFRAIENRRFLLRSTNTGLTAIVDPVGRTVSKLEPFSDGVLSGSADLLQIRTIYSQYLGEWPWWGVSLLSLFFFLKARFTRKRNESN